MSRWVLAGAVALLVGFVGGAHLHHVVAQPEGQRKIGRYRSVITHDDFIGMSRSFLGEFSKFSILVLLI